MFGYTENIKNAKYEFRKLLFRQNCMNILYIYEKMKHTLEFYFIPASVERHHERVQFWSLCVLFFW